MIIDTSAVVAILSDEPEREAFVAAIDSAPSNRISAATLFELCVVVDSRGDRLAGRELDEFIRLGEFVIEPFTAEHASIARSAYAEFGRGSGHEAKLNLGDCFSYALAIAADEPLLFKGDDFGHTDVTPAG